MDLLLASVQRWVSEFSQQNISRSPSSLAAVQNAITIRGFIKNSWELTGWLSVWLRPLERRKTSFIFIPFHRVVQAWTQSDTEEADTSCTSIWRKDVLIWICESRSHPIQIQSKSEWEAQLGVVRTYLFARHIPVVSSVREKERKWKNCENIYFVSWLCFPKIVFGTLWGTLKTFHLIQMAGVLNKNYRMHFKLNENRLPAENVKLACGLRLSRIIFICLNMYKGGRQINWKKNTITVAFTLAKGL